MIVHTEAGMIEGAKRQYRDYFRTMALGGRWVCVRAEPGETLSGIVIGPIHDFLPGSVILVDNVQARSENQMVILLSASIRNGSGVRV